MQLTDSIEKYAYGTINNRVSKKENIKSKDIIKNYRND